MSKISRFFLIFVLLLQLGFFWETKFVLHSNLDETEANNIILLLSKQGIESEKLQTKDKFSVVINQNSSSKAIKILRNNGLPRKEFDTLGKMFNNSGIIASPTQENIKYLHALSQELEETISNIDGVMVTRVNIVTSKENSLGQELSPASASVFIKYHPDYNMMDNLLKVKQLVANSVPKLDYAKVSVSLFESIDSDLFDSATNTNSVDSTATSTATIITMFILFFAVGVTCYLFKNQILSMMGFISPDDMDNSSVGGSDKDSNSNASLDSKLQDNEKSSETLNHSKSQDSVVKYSCLDNLISINLAIFINLVYSFWHGLIRTNLSFILSKFSILCNFIIQIFNSVKFFRLHYHII